MGSRVSDAGGVPIVITKPERDLLHVWPMVLQDGKSILFTIWEGSGKSNFASRIAVTSLDDGVVHPLGLAGVRVLGAIGNQLVYLQADGTVMAVSFDQRRAFLHPRNITAPADVGRRNRGGAHGHDE